MESVAPRPLALARAEVLLAALVAACASLGVAVFAPPGGDAAAHLYRTLLLREGVWVWDNLWYGGHYPFASYSALYYVPAAIVGNVPLVVAGAIVSAALFSAIAHEQWGEAARWPARVFAVAAAIPLFTGTYSYALGMTAALGALRLLQLDRPLLAVGAAALALGFSPLAFAFLLLALGAVALARACVERATIVVAAGVTALLAVQAGVLLVFPSDGRYPYSTLSLAGVLAVSGLAVALAVRAEGARVLAAFFALWAAANVVAFLVPSPFGDNLARLRFVVFPLVLLVVVLARARPRAPAVAALAVALVYNVAPDVSALPKRIDDAPTAEAAFWAPALAFLRERARPGERVEVVPTFGHWEAWWLPRAGFALARGWYRQLDIAENPELYRDPLQPAEYRRWLRRMAVRYVLLPRARLGPLGAGREAALLRSGRSGLVRVHRSEGWTIYGVPGAAPLLTGRGRSSLTTFAHDRVAGRVAAAGAYRLRVRWTPLWRVVRGDVCLTRAPDGMTRMVVRQPGRFALAAADDAVAVVRAAVRRGDTCLDVSVGSRLGK